MDSLTKVRALVPGGFKFGAMGVDINDAAEKIVNQLIPDSKNSNSSSVHANMSNASTKAAKVLEAFHGGEGSDLDHVKSQIDFARQQALKNVGARDYETASAAFNDKVIEIVTGKLDARMKLLYKACNETLKQRFKDEKIGSLEKNKEMAALIREARLNGFCLQDEVTNALSFVDEKQENIVGFLFYLFGGKLTEQKNKNLSEAYDAIRDQAAAAHLGNDMADTKKLAAFKQKFNMEARRKIASRLPEKLRNAYFSKENELQAKLARKEITYGVYRDSMAFFIKNSYIAYCVDEIMASVGQLSPKRVNELLDYTFRYEKPIFRFGVEYTIGALRECAALGTAEQFELELLIHTRNHPDLEGGEHRFYEDLVLEARRRLFSKLSPEKQGKINDGKKILDQMFAAKVIDEEGYRESFPNFVKNLLTPEKSDSNSGPEVSTAVAATSAASNKELTKAVSEALRASIGGRNKEKDVIEALIMCCGGFVNNHARDFNLQPLCEAKNAYMAAGKGSNYRPPALVVFPVDHAFSIEARKQLSEMLSEPLRGAYLQHEQQLGQHMDRGIITASTYSRAMEMFLNGHLEAAQHKN